MTTSISQHNVAGIKVEEVVAISGAPPTFWTRRIYLTTTDGSELEITAFANAPEFLEVEVRK